MRRLLCLTASIALAGCAINSGVVQMGPETFMVSRQAATGFSGMGKLKAEAMREAGAHCTKQGKTVEVVNSTESQPPFLAGNFPRVEITFRCR